jgi:hypothetical protein
MNATLATLIFALHLGVIAFNVFGLIAVPLGAWRGWRFVRVFWWRALHLALLGLVAVQAAFGQICFLTLWQSELEGNRGPRPMIQAWIETLIFWPLPVWAFALLYAAILVYAIWLWRAVPPVRS